MRRLARSTDITLTPLLRALPACFDRHPQQVGAVQLLVAHRWAASAPNPFTIVVPALGESISEGTVLSILAASGRVVSADDVLATLETDKVTVDVRAPRGGVISDVLVKIGDNVAVGGALFTMSESGQGVVASQQPPNAVHAAAPAAQRPPQSSPPKTVSAPEHARRRMPAIRFPKRRSGGAADIGSGKPSAAASQHRPAVPPTTVPTGSPRKSPWESTQKPPPTAINAVVIAVDGPLAPFRTTVPFSAAEMSMVDLGGALDLPVEGQKDNKKK